MALFSTQVRESTSWAITIPANGGTGTSVQDLLTAAGYYGEVKGYIIGAYLAGTAGTLRPAFLAATTRPGVAITATDFSTNGEYVAAGQVFYKPVERDFVHRYLQSTGGSTIVAQCDVLL